MKLREYLDIRNRGGKALNAIGIMEAKIFGLKIKQGGWLKNNEFMELTELQIHDAVKATMKSKHIQPSSVQNLMHLLDGKDCLYDDQNLYVMKNDFGMLKIGVSKEPIKRRNALSNSSGCRIEIVGLYRIKGSAYAVEQKLHKVYKPHRLIGEWFSENSFTLAEIECNLPEGFIKIK